MKYPIHGTILRIVANLLTTMFFGGFSYSENKQEFENEIENINRRRNALRHNHHRRPRRDEVRGLEQQHDVYIK